MCYDVNQYKLLYTDGVLCKKSFRPEEKINTNMLDFVCKQLLAFDLAVL